MSLIKQNRAFGLWDFLFIGLGIVSAAWFFLSYPSQDPRSIMESGINEDSATLRAAEVLNKLGYSTGNSSTRADYQVEVSLLDSLQQKLGRPESIRTLKKSEDEQVFPFNWNVLFYPSTATDEFNWGGIDEEEHLTVRLDDKGRWIELLNATDNMPSEPLNRNALQYAFKEDSTKELWRSIPDSAWQGVLSFDVENGYDASLQNEPETEKGEEDAHVFSLYELKRLGEYYLQSSVWKPEEFELSDVQIRTLDNTRVADLNYVSIEPQLGQDIRLRLRLMPTGSLLNLTADYNSDSNGASTAELMELATLVIGVIFGIIVMVTFIYRMRARVVDTKSALVISILGGLIIPASIFLENIETVDLFNEGIIWFRLVDTSLEMAIFGAFGSLAFFALAAVGDSLTRQHWQKKLVCYDYIRQGMLFNRPIGEVLLRSVILTFVAAGFWSLLLWFMPEIYFNLEWTFVSYEAAWAPLYLLLENAWFSLIFILGIFLVVGSLIYSRIKRRWVLVLVTTLLFGLVGPLPFYFGPVLEQYAMMAIFGLGLSLIYLKWDFLTLLFTHFLFISLLMASSGWLVSSSPDLHVFIVFSLFLILIIGWAIFSIVKGKEEQSLPSYVPEYVEELAQEERIKQELQIARGVQNSFLPTETPDLEGLDIAAICQPAYETGGDYYDFIQLDDHRVALTIGDVSGKGIQAAFYMTFTKGILHSLCRETDSPAELLKKANRLFCDNARKGTFISLVYGIVDLEKKTFTFSRAGHNPILHLQAKDGKLNELQPNGLGLGLTRNASFDENIREVKLDLEEGDLLVLYTDGIVEALNETHQFYGGNRLLEQIKNHKNKSSREIIEVLSEDVASFIGSAKQHDDMTMMVIKMNTR